MRYAGRIAALGALVLAGAPGAQAQDTATAYPSRAITLVVPQAAGGPPDVVARLVAAPLAELLGKPIIIENRAGASGSLGAGIVAKSAPDGYTLLLVDITFAIAPSLIAKVNYNPVTDFAPLAVIARSWLTMAINPALPAGTVAEFVALAKAKPDDIKFGSSGIGSPPHLGGIAFAQATGTRLAHVPYRGTAAAMTDVVGGHIQVLFVSYTTAAAQAKAGQVRILAVAGANRFPSLPEVPTFKQAGIDMGGVDEGSWFGYAAPAGTPAPIVAKLNAAIDTVLRQPETRARLEGADYKVEGGAPAVLGRLIESQSKYWGDLLKKSGIEPNP